MRLICVLLLVIITNNIVVLSKECSIKKLNTKLICYYSKIDLKQISNCKCSHIVLPTNTDIEQIGRLRDVFKKSVKLLITINEFNQDVVELIDSKQLDGIELNLKKLNSRDDINDFLSTIRQKFNNLFTLLTVPAKPEILAKFYDFKSLTKYVDGYVLQTGFLGMSKNITFHPSRLSGLWDMQNTDSVVDLVSGLGAPLSKLIITAPVQGFRFKLQNSKYTAPGSPALEVQTITRNELCKLMRNGRNWTLERDQDQAGPFIFSEDQWIAFDDATSIDIKAKYSRIRGLAGLALMDLAQDGGEVCDETTLLDAAFDGLNRQARAPRGAVLHSLEREIRETPHTLDTVQLSPYRISRVIDVEGNIHVIRQDTRTEFACSRQGYFVHPRSCNRFYRCVKFDQLVDDFNVFEFDCPAGLVFDERVEVCVWPGNVEHGSACAGSSEIAPVPQQRFVCPSEPGYYADPENCRWFFACLDHGKSAMSAYEFRCPFGLVFDETRLLCEWAWLVPRCASGYTKTSSVVYGYGNNGVASLEHYDGLGVLPVTQLGGLNGPLQEPVAQIYTNVGSGGIIANSGINGYKLISSNAGFGGLSENAALSLQNAGLLKVGQYNTLGQHDSNYKAIGEGQQYIATGAIGNAYQGIDLENSGKISGGSTILTAGQQNAHLINSLAHDTSAQIHGSTEFGAKSYQNIEQYHQHSNNNAVLDQNNVKLTNDGVAGNINIVGGGYSAVRAFDSGIEISHNGVGSSTVTHVTPSPISVTTLPSVPTVTTVPIPSISTIKSFQSYNGGVVANLPQLQYRVEGHNSGFSTDQQNLNVANISTNYVNLISSTPDYSTAGIISTPSSVLHEEIPFQNSGSYSYENQALLSTLEGASLKTGNNEAKSLTFVQRQPAVKVQPAVSFNNYYAKAESNAANAEKNQNLYGEVKLLQPAVSVASFEGYHYDQPSVSTYQGYNYQKPSVQYEEKPLVKVQSTLQPAVSFSTFQSYNNQQDSVVSQEKTLEGVQSLGVSVEQPTFEYLKPNVQFEEKPAAKIQPAVSFSTYESYSTPSVKFEEKVQPTVQTVAQPAVSFTTFQSYDDKQASAVSQGAAFEKVASLGTVIEQQQPSVVKVQPTVPTVVQPAVSFTTYQSYDNNRASAAYESKSFEKVTSSGTLIEQQQPSVVKVQSTVQAVVQPAVSYSSFQSYNDKQASANSQEATLEKVESFGTSVEQHPAVSVSKFEGYTYPQPTVKYEEKPLANIQPTVQTVVRPAVSFTTFQSYGNNKASQTYGDKSFEKVSSLGTIVEQPIQTVVQPGVSFTKFQSYNTQNIAQDKNVATLIEQQPAFQGYYYEKPSIKFEERPLIKVQPVVKQPVSVSSFETYSNTNPSAQLEEKPLVKIESPAVVQPTVQTISQPAVSFATFQSYNHQKSIVAETVPQQPTVQTVLKQGYSYPKPSVVFEETPIRTVPVSTTYKQNTVKGYSYQKPSVIFEEKPQIYVSTTPVPIVSSTPAIVSSFSISNQAQNNQDYAKSSTVLTSVQPSAYNFQKVIEDYSYRKQQTPAWISYGTTSTARPSVVSSYSYTAPVQYNYQQSASSGYVYEKPQIQFEEVPLPVTEVPFVKKTAYITGNLNQNSGYVYEKPQIQLEEGAFVENEQRRGKFDEQAVLVENDQVASTPRTIIDYNYVQTTPKPSFDSTVLTAAEVPVTPKQFYYYDSRLSSTPQPEIKYATTVVPTVSVISSTTTSRPIAKYSFSSLDDIPPTPEYKPIRQRVKITTPIPELSREYLPITAPSHQYLPVKSTTALPSDEEVIISTKRPVKVVKIVRPKTIIKQNDFNPLLTAKLGAQCTCVSNTLKLRKKPLKIIVQEVDDDNDDGYVVDSNQSGDQVFVENYQYDSQRTFDGTSEIQVSAAKSSVSDKDIAKAVRTGLNLVKETVKDGVGEALDGRAFDRYGPGGVRGRDERLQGTIDCQRPGLFRHPTECNKFYSCRWDCTKKRYTLHVFNCPVHLTFDNNLGACNWPSQGPACLENTLLPSD